MVADGKVFMPKKIQVVIKATLELPDKAEVIRFKDEEGVTTDHIKFLGKLFCPEITWLQYYTSDLLKKKYGKGLVGGTGYETIDDELANKYFMTVAEWYLEEE
jgi:hypothetical protein